MAFKMSKQEIKERDEFVDSLRKKLETLNAAVTKYNEVVAEAYGALEDEINDFNGSLSDARDFVERLKDDFTGQYDDKSEKWQEGDKGSVVRDWLDTFDNVSLYDAEIEASDPVGEVDVDGIDELENLETEPAE